jgi:hypothetical protein
VTGRDHARRGATGHGNQTGNLFIQDLASRIAARVQLTSDGSGAYQEAVEGAVGADMDYARLVKIYGDAPEAEKCHGPAECIGCQTRVAEGDPDPAHIGTSFVERLNPSIRMRNRRFTRLTNAFSKKFMGHAHALAIYFAFYNFRRIHKTLGVTPAMAAGLMGFEDIVALIDARAGKPKRSATYKKRAQISN